MTEPTPAELPEMTPAEALVEDYARLRASFRESVRHERALQGAPGAAAADSDEQELEQRLERMSRAEQDLAAVLASPSWRIGRMVTAVPRRLRRDKA